MSRWVMVDDTDASIKYTGDWFANTGTLDSSGNWGAPYLSTLHGTKTQGSFSYSFSGSAFTLTGAIQVPRSSASANTTWECIVDGASIAVDNPAAVENRVEFCAGSGITDGPHTLQVNAKGSSSQTFWFDHLQYQPSASVSLADAAIYIDTTDPMWGFGTGWNPVSPGYMTNQTGAKVDFEFNGVSFKWYGFYDARFPFAVSTASYSIDGAAPVNFTLNGVTAQQTSVQYSQVFFTTGTLSPGNHKVEVTYNGNANTTPLSVEVIVVQNGTSTSGTSGGAGGGSSTSTTASAGGTIGSNSRGTTTATGSISGAATISSASNGGTSDAAKSNTGAIVGGVVGGVAILLLAALLFLRMARRRKYRTMAESPGSIIEPVPYSDYSIPMDAYSPVSATSRGRKHGSATAPYDSQSYTASSNHPPTTQTPFQSPPSSNRSPRVGKESELQQPPTRIEAPRVVQDVDSGIRLVAVHGDDSELVHVLPPVYSQT